MEKKSLFVLKMLLVFFAGVAIAGCATLHETGRKVWGSSVEHLQEKRSQALSAESSLEPAALFEKCRLVISSMRAEVYLQDEAKGYLVAMKFPGHVDTTQVGFFVGSFEPGSTRVEVVSLSPQLKKEVAELLFAQMKN